MKVLDSSALLSYLEKKGRYQVVQNALAEASGKQQKLLMATVNWGEVYYILIGRLGFAEAQRIMQLVSTFPIALAPADEFLTQEAAYYKATKKLPYADCFAAALAKMHKAALITTDRDFRILKHEIKITFV